MLRSVRLLPLALLVLTACSSSPGGNTPDGGDGLPPDVCNTRDEALSSADCQLAQGVEVQRYISTSDPVDQDWYSVQLPATAGPRTLVHVTAGYRAQSTAVNLSVTMLTEEGQALERKVDAHGQGAPQQVEMLVPYGQPNAKLLLLVGDAPTVTTHPNFDARNPYFIKVEVVENPDTNEPNDTQAQATPLTLTAQNGIQVASATGTLATAGDVDRFSVDVPAGKILYAHLSGKTLTPQTAYRLSYTLLRPDGTAEAAGNVRPAVEPPNLATARRVAQAGKWTVVVQGYRAGTDTQPPPGDLRQQYTLDVRLLDEEDPQDRVALNDGFEKAFSRAVALDTSTSFTGRLGSVPDTDWYAVTLAASAEPTVLRYRLEPLGTGGRFEALPGTLDRQVRVLTRVPVGATNAEQQAACYSREDACPKGYGENRFGQPLVEGFCTDKPSVRQPPLCLYSARDEGAQGFTGLSNFQGAVPVAPHTSGVTYYFLVEDNGNDWADDRDYRLTVGWETDSDDKARYQGGTVEQPSAAVLNPDTVNSFPAPPAGPSFEAKGTLTYGYGRLQGTARTTGFGVRGPDDYDAVPSDMDTYEFQLPPAETPADKTWEVQWVVEHLPDGGTPANLALDVTFCDGDNLDGGVCTPVSTGSAGAPLTLAYRPDPLRAWHSQTATLSGLQPLYSQSVGSTSTTVTLQPYACACLEPRFIRGGKMKVAVSAAERTDYAPVQYTLRTAYADYPKSYTTDAGIVKSCPAQGQDGGVAGPDGGVTPNPGCYFTRQP